jgi:hypothetical protein
MAKTSKKSYSRPSNYGMMRTAWNVGKLGYKAYKAYNRAVSRGSKRSSSAIATTVRRGAKKAKSMKRYVSTGVVGPKFRKTVRANPSRFLRRGTVQLYEAGDTVASGGAVYVGHGVGCIAVWNAACIAVVLKLFKAIGHRPVSTHETVCNAADFRVYMEYILDQGDVAGSTSYNVGSTDTYETVGRGLRNLIEAQIAAIAATGDFAVTKIYLDNQANTNPICVATLGGRDLMLEMDVSSTLCLQNRTLGDGVTDTGDSEAVTNNPLVGRIYEGDGNGSGMKLHDNTLDLGDPNQFVASGWSGEISVSSEQANMSSGQTDVYKRPPPANAFSGVKRTNFARLNPGQIRSSYLRWYKKITFNMLIKKLFVWLRDTSVPAPEAKLTHIGKFRFFGFEKKLKTNQTEADISVGFEVKQTVRVLIYERTHIMAPTHNVYT